MNIVFVKEAQSSIIRKKSACLNPKKIGKDSYIVEINLNANKLSTVSNELQSIDNNKSVNFLYKIKNLKNVIITKKFRYDLEKIIKKNNLNGYSAIFSNELKRKPIKEYLDTILNDFSIKEYSCKNTMESNFEKYIDEFKEKYNLSIASIFPVIIVENINNLSFNVINKLNKNYKELSVFCIGKVTKSFQNKIKKINEEFGSCIQILNRNTKNLEAYNVCILIDVLRENVFKYKFSKNICYINFMNKENDKFNISYLKMQEYIKNGKYDINSIKELYEIYGKVTVSNAILD